MGEETRKHQPKASPYYRVIVDSERAKGTVCFFGSPESVRKAYEELRKKQAQKKQDL